MDIFVLGLNHKSAPLEVREKLSISEPRRVDFLGTLARQGVFRERLVLSTCNRTEIYGVDADAPEVIQRAKKALSEFAQVELPRFEDKLYVYRQPDSVEHLFRVASGLDSMVLGETEILGQVKDAYLAAHRLAQTGKVLNKLFQRSLNVAKDLRTQTEIGAGRVGVASVTVDLAEKIFGDLSRVTVMVLGTGQMASQLVKTMSSKGARPLIVSSRRYERAENLAQDLGVRAVSFDDFEEHALRADILVASTQAPHWIVKEPQVRRWMRLRRDKPLFLVDIALPRNIEPGIERIDNVYLYNLDDLQGIADQNRQLREGQIEQCLKLVDAHTERYMRWLGKEFGAACP